MRFLYGVLAFALAQAPLAIIALYISDTASTQILSSFETVDNVLRELRHHTRF